MDSAKVQQLEQLKDLALKEFVLKHQIHMLQMLNVRNTVRSVIQMVMVVQLQVYVVI